MAINTHYHHQVIIREIFACGIQNPRKFSLWNLESRALESEIQLKESGIPLRIGIQNQVQLSKTGIQYLESGIRSVGIQDPRLSWIPFHEATYILRTESGNAASMREPLDGSLWWYWIAANAAKKNGASFKNYHRLSHLFYLCGVQIRQSLLCNMRDWSQG